MKGFLEKISLEKWLMIVMFLPLLIIDKHFSFSIDDFFLIRHGEIILTQGFVTDLPLSMHSGPFIMQQWLSAVLIYLLYKLGGFNAVLIFAYVFFIIEIILMYKILMLITSDKIISTSFTFLFGLLMGLLFVVARPQMISYTCILLVIYLAEEYIIKKQNKYLYFIPFLFILQINAHASMYPILIMILMAYIANIKFFTNKYIIEDDYNKKLLIIISIVSIICLFINPYGINMITYIFKSFDASTLSLISFEMQSLSLKNYGIIVFVIILITIILLYIYKNTIKLRYLLLYLGSLILCIQTIRNLSLFIIGSTIFIASYIKTIDNKEKIIKKIFGYYKITIPILIVLCLIMRIVFIGNFENQIRGDNQASLIGLKEYFEKQDNNDIKIFSDTQTSTYLEFLGYPCFVDTRMELFLEKNLGKPIIDEFILFELGGLDKEEFISKYDFDYFVLKNTDANIDYFNKHYTGYPVNEDLIIFKIK